MVIEIVRAIGLLLQMQSPPVIVIIGVWASRQFWEISILKALSYQMLFNFTWDNFNPCLKSDMHIAEIEKKNLQLTPTDAK